MAIICDRCGRDIDAIGQDNMSSDPGYALCETCYYEEVEEERYYEELRSQGEHI